MQEQTIRGVNLGGWFIIERWITPSLFDGLDARNEFELSRTPEGRRRIRAHHQTFITKRDLTWLQRRGITILRVPVGHWILGGDTRYVEAIDRLDWLMETTASLGLQVLLDLHAAPGAQNRSEHSGSGNTLSDKTSTKWLNNKISQQQTIEVLVQLAERYKDAPNVWGIELLNEPAVDFLGLKLARFYRRAYRAITQVARPGTRIVFSDGYAPLRLTNCLGLMSRREFPAVMDTHVYQVFGRRNKNRSFERHLRLIRLTATFLRIIRLPQPIIVGEWSAMLPIRTTPDQTRRYAATQTQAFNLAEAHFFWNYKTESDGRWNYRDQAEKGLLQ